MARTRRTGGATSLDVVVEGEQADEPSRSEPLMPWWAAALAGGVLSAAVMWVLVCGAFALGWIATPDTPSGAVFSTGTQAWLLTYLAGANIAGLNLTLPPLGLTILAVVVGAGLAGFATSQARLAAPPELTGRERRSLALRVAGVFTLAHAVAVLVPSFVVATAEQSARALIGAVLVGGVAGLVGATRTAQWHPTDEWPAWARSLPRAVAAGVLVMQVTGALVLTLALLAHRSRVTELHDALAPGTLGGILLLVVQLVWLPNLVVWCSSWALGAGLQVGVGSVVTPAVNEVGLLPGVPVLGAMPTDAAGGPGQLWWLLSGVLAGATCALVVLRSRPRARFDETALVGGLTGVLAGLVVVALGLLASGDIGTGRLVQVGVRRNALFVMAPTLLGLSGVLTGALRGLVLRPPRGRDDDVPVVDRLADAPDVAADEPDEPRASTDRVGP